VHLRVERQTLRLLPITGAVLFTIRTRVQPLSSLSRAARSSLAATLRTVDEATVRYKGWVGLKDVVEQALAVPGLPTPRPDA
jgi:hypothetical protein